MTDAAIAITQSVVEQFTEQYLRSIGGEIEKDGDRWEATVPSDADTELETGRFGLVCGDPSVEPDDGEFLLHPESSFFQDILTEASQRNPTGRIRLPSDDADIEPPAWLREGPLEVTQATFSPYYDRSAVVILYRVRIETVSEFQTELLQTIALDVRSGDEFPEMGQIYLDLTSPDQPYFEGDPIDLADDQVEQLVDDSRQRVVDRVEQTVDEVHQEASRAADAELEEFRQLQQQRIDELQERRASLSSKIDELSGSIGEGSGDGDHLEALKQRKKLKTELEETESELDEIKRRRERGFPSKQKEIRDRHALEVVVSPLTITQVEYERGEVAFEIAEESNSTTLSVGYGSGVGVTEELHCDNCEQRLSYQNPLSSIRGGIRCHNCI